jgi:hypothetical protein
MKVVEDILRVDGGRDKKVEKRCQDYGKKLVKEMKDERNYGTLSRCFATAFRDLYGQLSLRLWGSKLGSIRVSSLFKP